MNGHLDVFRLILEKVENKNPAKWEWNTPLHMAARNGHLDASRFIIGELEDKNPSNRYGATVKDIAQDYKHLTFKSQCSMLIQQGCVNDILATKIYLNSTSEICNVEKTLSNLKLIVLFFGALLLSL